MQFDSHTIHAPRVHCTEGLKDTRGSMKAKKNTKTEKLFPVPKRIKVTCRGSVIPSITTTSSDECESGQMDFRITATVDSGSVIQKVAATKFYKCSAAISTVAEDFPVWCDAKKSFLSWKCAKEGAVKRCAARISIAMQIVSLLISSIQQHSKRLIIRPALYGNKRRKLTTNRRRSWVVTGPYASP